MFVLVIEKLINWSENIMVKALPSRMLLRNCGLRASFKLLRSIIYIGRTFHGWFHAISWELKRERREREEFKADTWLILCSYVVKHTEELVQFQWKHFLTSSNIFTVLVSTCTARSKSDKSSTKTWHSVADLCQNCPQAIVEATYAWKLKPFMASQHSKKGSDVDRICMGNKLAPS